mmetsp:Transcript_6447/g.13711  ORF Transcript_6447/g.13711 Transcript_6447/m.13711 type:complete len:316 (+) Transcript_6447:58-1005(+)
MNSFNQIQCLFADSVDNFVIHDQYKCGTSSTKDVGKSSLEESTGSFGLEDLGEAVGHTAVNLLILRLGGFDLKTTLHGIEWVGDNSGNRDGNLGDNEFGEKADGGEILLVRVEGLEGILETELRTTVDNNSDSRRSNSVIKRSSTVVLDGLLQAIPHTVVLLFLSKISSENSTDVDKRVDNGVGGTSSSGTGCNLGSGELAEFGVLVVLREHSLDSILECQVKGGGRNVSDAIGEVSTPQRTRSEFADMTLESISHTGVSLHFTRDDTRVRVLVLDGELDLLQRRGERLGDGTGDTSGSQVDKGVHLLFWHDEFI